VPSISTTLGRLGPLLLSLCALCVAFLLAGQAAPPVVAVASAKPLPQPGGRVNDFANLLSADERATLESQLLELDRETTVEVAVVTINDLDGRNVEDYALALFNEWGIGKKRADNGVLILVAPVDRSMRIEVGYGLEGILPDGLAGAVIRKNFLPHFVVDDNYRAGILDGTARILEIIRRNEKPTAEQLATWKQEAADAKRSPAYAVLVSPIVLGMIYIVGIGIGARVFLLLGLSGFFLAAFSYAAYEMATPTSLVVLALVAFAVLALGIRKGKTPETREHWRGRGRAGRGNGWVSGGSDSGRSSSSSSSDSGSSFGGGSSGGGGASGRW
jgi:uncharacterized protein